MGTPVPPPLIIEPVPAGNPCAIAWGPGKPFGDGPTPESIVVNLSTNGSANGSGILTQVPGLPCLFIGLIDTWSVIVSWELARSVARANPLGFPVDFVVQSTEIITEFITPGEFLVSVRGSLFVFFPEVI